MNAYKLQSFLFLIQLWLQSSVTLIFKSSIIFQPGYISFQYDELSCMGMLLTDAQRKWVDILKESAKKKPPDHSIRPEVCMWR